MIVGGGLLELHVGERRVQNPGLSQLVTGSLYRCSKSLNINNVVHLKCQSSIMLYINIAGLEEVYMGSLGSLAVSGDKPILFPQFNKTSNLEFFNAQKHA